MRFQVISLPHTQTTDDYSACAYTQKVRKFATMMTDRGHDVFLYAGQYDQSQAHEHFVCLNEKDQKRHGFNGPKDYLKIDFNGKLPIWEEFNDSVIAYMRSIIQPEDIICSITGEPMRRVKEAFPNNLFVEFGVGYEGIMRDSFRVFESYAWRNHVYGMMGIHDGAFMDEVIPNYFDIDDFEIAIEKSDYYLYIGRLIDRKGWRIAQDVCQRLGVPLIVAGPGEFDGYGYYVGTLGPAERKAYMSRAKAVFVPTLYIPPFEGVHIEAMLSGTPVITTDFGVFSETVVDYVNGVRCKSLQDFVDAVTWIERQGEQGVVSYSPKSIRRAAIRDFSTGRVALQYEKYFERLLTLYGDGWNTLKDVV